MTGCNYEDNFLCTPCTLSLLVLLVGWGACTQLWLPPADAPCWGEWNFPLAASLGEGYTKVSFMGFLGAYQTVSICTRFYRTLSLLVTKGFLCESLRGLLFLFITTAGIQNFLMTFNRIQLPKLQHLQLYFGIPCLCLVFHLQKPGTN